MLELRQPALELGDALPRRRQLVTEAVPVPGTHVLIPIGARMHALEAWWTHAGGAPRLNLPLVGGVLREACGYPTNTETPMAEEF